MSGLSGGSRRVLLSVAGTALLLAACAGEGTALDTARAFMAAVESFDTVQAQDLVCEAQQGRLGDILAAFGGNVEMGEAFDLAFQDLAYEELSNDGAMALVHISGTLTISFLGQQESQPVNEDHVVVKEGTRWVVCDP